GQADAGATLTVGAALTGSAITVTGGAGADTFDFSAASATTATLNGGVGTDTFIGRNAANAWTINAADGGSVTSSATTLTFTGMENLTGGNAADTFVFAAAGSIAGALDGGTGANSINIAAVAGANTIDLQAGTISGVVGTTFTNVTAFTGDNTADVLVGTNAATTWNINTANTGTLSTGQSFTNIPNLTGGTNNDDFTLSGGTLSGAIVGGTGSNTLAGSTAYNVTGADSGSATGVTGGFTQIGSLTGTAGGDTFAFQNAGTLSGSVDGLGGSDTVNLSAKAGAVAINQQAATFTGLTGTYANIESF